MNYKIYKESKLPDIGLDELKLFAKKKIAAHKHRHDPLYFDEDDLWFWHDEKRKRVAFVNILKVKKESLHGFGNMIKISYRKGHYFDEGDKVVDMHLVNVEECNNSPADIARMLNEAVDEAIKRQNQGRKIHKFTTQKKMDQSDRV